MRLTGFGRVTKYSYSLNIGASQKSVSRTPTRTIARRHNSLLTAVRNSPLPNARQHFHPSQSRVAATKTTAVIAAKKFEMIVNANAIAENPDRRQDCEFDR